MDRVWLLAGIFLAATLALMAAGQALDIPVVGFSGSMLLASTFLVTLPLGSYS